MTDAIKKELDLLVEIILKTVKAEEIYLFGSYARGDARADSDLNLYVVLEDGERDALECAQEISIAIAYTTVSETRSTDILAQHSGDFYNKTCHTQWEKAVFEEGVKIYEKPSQKSVAMA